MASNENLQRRSFNTINREQDFQIIKGFSLLLLLLFEIACILTVIYSIYYDSRVPIDDIRIEFVLELCGHAVYLCIGIFGIIGAIRESVIMVLVYTVFTAITGVAYVALHRVKVIPIPKDEMAKIIDKVWQNRHQKTSTMSQLERFLECCGREGSTEYVYRNETIPNSCYDKQYHVNENGCFGKVLKIVDQTNSGTFIILTWLIFMEQCFSFIMSIFYIGAILDRDFPDDD